MNFYLKHYFNPFFDHLSVKPTMTADGKADRHNLGYVQNVIKGQILAEFVDPETVAHPRSEFLMEEPVFPEGLNTRVDPDYPEYLLSDANGYAFYLDGKITVKNLLNARGDISFQTGNIFFVGNLAVHGDVRAGFEVQANDVLIKGLVEGGIARAQKDLAVMGGVRGRADGRCMLDAGKSLRVTHVENAELRSHGRLFVEKFCLHSRLYVEGDIAVQGRMYGGVCQSNGTVYVKETLGNQAGTPTEIQLGYNPFDMRKLERIEANMAELNQRIMHYTAVAGHLTPEENDLSRRLEAAQQKFHRLQEHRETLWSMLAQNETQADACRVVVSGTVHPGVVISIGRSMFLVKETMSNVAFSLQGDSVVAETIRKR